jgi:hypothetical protein
MSSASAILTTALWCGAVVIARLESLMHQQPKKAMPNYVHRSIAPAITYAYRSHCIDPVVSAFTTTHIA